MAKKLLGAGAPKMPELDFMNILARCVEKALEPVVDEMVTEIIEEDSKLKKLIKSQVRDCMQTCDIASIPEWEPGKQKAADVFAPAPTLDAVLKEADVPLTRETPLPILNNLEDIV